VQLRVGAPGHIDGGSGGHYEELHEKRLRPPGNL
jgi:hypothetical protein